jgi:hypothetical protein
LARTDGDAARIIRRFCHILMKVSSGKAWSRGQVVWKGWESLLITYPLPEIIIIIIIIYLFLTAIGLIPSGSSTVHIYTQTENGTNITIKRKKIWEVRAVPVFASYTLVFALKLRKRHGKSQLE